MNRDDNKGITAVCGHPMCDWHTGSMNRDATRTVAKQQIGI